MLAKLLATENINVVRGQVRTASFDIKNRVLVLPNWKNMSSQLEQMLILHEVGHALFTSNEKYGKVFEKGNRHLRGYANIIEDARIESNVKDLYPGCRKTFTQGYQELRDMDFFGIKNRNINSFLLIDRINLYFKIGYNSGIKFTEEERVFVDRAEKCKTEEEVLELSAELYEYSKKEKAEKQENQMDDLMYRDSEDEVDEDQDETYEDLDLDSEEAEDGETSTLDENKVKPKIHGDFKDGVDPDLEPETLDTLESNLADSADTDIKFEYFEPEFQYTTSDKIIIPFTRVISELKGSIDANILLGRKGVQSFKASSSPIVNYLIKEFEMKKSATAYKRAKISKLGQIDTSKLYAYKLKEDIFKQMLSVKEGKKHGMVFLLDWSGSMANHIQETLEQVINLAMFCQRTQISYQVFAFTDGYTDVNSLCNAKLTCERGMGSNNTFKLLELFSSNMTNAEFNVMIALMLNRPWRITNYGLNGTPLAEATLFMVKYLEDFKKKFQVEKLSLITLTDGEGSALYNNLSSTRDTLQYDPTFSKRIKVKAILQDSVTKKQYPLGDSGNAQTAAFYSLIRDRLDCKIVGFYIMSASRSEAYRFIKNNFNELKTHQQMSSIEETITSSLRKDKHYILNKKGYDEFYILSSMKINESSIKDVNPDMSASAISSKLTKMMNTRKMSRIVLDKFIEKVT